jgi:predicted aldo/keto reductase-like oxidoreductase
LIRFISISCHNSPSVLVAALDRFAFDSLLCPTSVLDHFILSFAEEVIPLAKAKGVAVTGMKVLGLGGLADIYDRALRYAWGLPIDTAIVGMVSLAQLKKNLAVAESYKPLTDLERLELFKEVLPRVTPANLPWKADDFSRPSQWGSR